MKDKGLYTAAWDQNVDQGAWRGWWRIVNGQGTGASPLTDVSRHPDKLDVFVRGENGGIYTAAWDQNVDQGKWRGWWRIVNGQGETASSIAAVARDPDKLDVFIRGKNNGIYTAAWDQHVDQGAWRGWWRIVNGQGEASSDIAAVSRDPNKLDVFIRGKSGQVYTAAWEQGVADGQWRGWWPVLDGRAMAGTSVAAVSRAPDKLDIFIVAVDGRVYTAAWEQNVAQGQWRGWWPILDGRALSGTSVAAVSRDPNKLDVFVIGLDHRIYTAAWDQNAAQGKWRGWWPILDFTAGTLKSVAVVSRDPHKLDVFALGQDATVWTAAWDQHVAQGAWRGWWRIA
jgi:alkylated DNA nucleotide flippase Atl1